MAELEFGSEIRVQEYHIPGYSKESLFRKFLIPVNGKWMEIHRVFDCEGHYHINEIDVDICIQGEKPVPIPEKFLKACGCVHICNCKCRFRKEQIQKELDEHGPWPTNKVKENCQKILESEDETIYA